MAGIRRPLHAASSQRVGPNLGLKYLGVLDRFTLLVSPHAAKSFFYFWKRVR